MSKECGQTAHPVCLWMVKAAKIEVTTGKETGNGWSTEACVEFESLDDSHRTVTAGQVAASWAQDRASAINDTIRQLISEWGIWPDQISVEQTAIDGTVIGCVKLVDRPPLDLLGIHPTWDDVREVRVALQLGRRSPVSEKICGVVVDAVRRNLEGVSPEKAIQDWVAGNFEEAIRR